MKNLTIFGESIIDAKSIEQIKNCFGEQDIAVLTADAHYGYGHPIGGAVAYRNQIRCPALASISLAATKQCERICTPLT